MEQNTNTKPGVLDMLQQLTDNDVFYRIINQEIAGLDNNGLPTYRTNHRVTIGQRGHELFLSMAGDLETAVRFAYEWAKDNKLVK